MSIIDYDWEGFVLNYLLPPDHPHYRDSDRFPGDINWISFNPKLTLLKKDISIDFLRVGKIFYLENDPDDLGELIEPIPVVLETYDYGEWHYDLPEKQNKKAYFFVGSVNPVEYIYEARLNQDEYKLIKRYRTSQQKEKIVSNRRKNAFDYIKARAKEIDLATDHTLFLNEKIKIFFDGYYNEYARYVESGSDVIISLLENSSEDWLQTYLPDLGTIQSEMIRILRSALIIPTKEQIEAEIEKYIV